MNNKTFLSLICVAIIVATALIYQATLVGTSTVLEPKQLMAQEGVSIARVRVAGKVAEQQILYQLEPKVELRFFLQDASSEEKGSIPVVYKGLKPDMFAPGRDVIIDGEFRDGTFYASNLLTQCPSKYEPPSAEKQYPLDQSS